MPFAPFDDALSPGSIEAFPNFTQPENPLDCWAIDVAERVFPGHPRAAARRGRLRRAARPARPLAPPRRPRGGVVRADHRGARGRRRGHGHLPRGHAPCTRPTRRRRSRSWRGPATSRSCAARARACARSPRSRAGGPSQPRRGAPAGPAADRPASRCPPARSPEHDSCALLERYGVTFAAARALRHCPTRRRRRCEQLGGPVVVKVDGPAHKQAAGGVVLGVGERRRRRARRPSASAAACSWRARSPAASRRSAA